jgi:hypothetical protein
MPLFAEIFLFAVTFPARTPSLQQKRLGRHLSYSTYRARTIMNSRFKAEFLLGCHEGWRNFWSPFTGLWRALADSWRTHVGTRKR